MKVTLMLQPQYFSYYKLEHQGLADNLYPSKQALSCVRRNNRSRKPAKSSLDGIHTQEMIHRFCGPGRSAYRENYQRLSLP